MYVALREMIERTPTGAVKRVFPGDEVTTFASWPVANQIAALSSRHVREAPAGEEPLARTLAGAATPQEVREAKARAFANATAQPKPALQPAAEATSPAKAAAATAQARVELKKDQPAPDEFVCSKCSFESRTAHGLSIHMGREHKGE